MVKRSSLQTVDKAPETHQNIINRIIATRSVNNGILDFDIA